MKYYLKVLQNYVNFKDRARRSEYWFFVLFNVIFIAIAAILDNLLGTTFKMDTGNGVLDLHYGYLYVLYALAVFLPGLAVSVRRLHDVGKSGWFYLIVLIPIIGWIWILVLFFTDSVSGENKWGANPKVPIGQV